MVKFLELDVFIAERADVIIVIIKYKESLRLKDGRNSNFGVPFATPCTYRAVSPDVNAEGQEQVPVFDNIAAA